MSESNAPAAGLEAAVNETVASLEAEQTTPQEQSTESTDKVEATETDKEGEASETEAKSDSKEQSAQPTSTDKKEAVKEAADKEIKKLEKEIRKYKVKIDDQEVEVDESELLSGYQMRRASQKRFEEAARLKKEAEQKVEFLKKNPEKALESLGLNVRELAENYILKQMEDEKLTPEQKKLREYEEKLRSYEDEKKQQEEAKRKEEEIKLEEHYKQEYSKKMKEALDSSGLPKTPYTVRRMAHLMSRALENGLEMEPKDAVGILREEYISDIKQLLGQADGETLLGLLGKEVSDKIRKTELAKVKAKTPPTPVKAPEVAKPKEEEKPKKKKTWDEFKAELDAIANKPD